MKDKLQKSKDEQKKRKEDYEKRVAFRKARDEENRKRVRESLRSFNQSFGQPFYGDSNLPAMQGQTQQQFDANTISPTFLTGFNE